MSTISFLDVTFFNGIKSEKSLDIFEKLTPLNRKIQQYLSGTIRETFPESLKDPITYFLDTPGKKIRPLFTALSCEAVGGNADDALPAAAGIELFHDFTLVHDDIMDRDDLRRGKPTIHRKWDEGTAILVGDALIGMAYVSLQKCSSDRLPEVLQHFSEAVIKVCEGQALDKEFEKASSVSLDEYLEMISKKTAWLFKVSCQIGAILGNGTTEQVEALTHFGYSLGMGFQIQDDLLDFIADETKLGKKVGSDFKMDKKTYVTLKYQECLRNNSHLRSTYPENIWEFPSLEALKKALYNIGAVEETRKIVDRYIDEALEALSQIQPLNEQNPLYQITLFLQDRQY